MGVLHAHSVSLGRSAASDLLDTELVKLGLQLIQLLGEVILALSPELTSLDLGRLGEKKPSAFPDASRIFQHRQNGRNIPWWAASCRIVRVVDVKVKMDRVKLDVRCGTRVNFFWRVVRRLSGHVMWRVAGEGCFCRVFPPAGRLSWRRKLEMRGFICHRRPFVDIDSTLSLAPSLPGCSDSLNPSSIPWPRPPAPGGLNSGSRPARWKLRYVLLPFNSIKRSVYPDTNTDERLKPSSTPTPNMPP